MSTAFLKPKSVNEPPQGAFQYIPRVRIFEADSAAGLEALLSGGFSVEAVDPDNYYVIESIEYSTAVTRTHNNQPDVRYSALVWATKVEII